MRLGSEPLLKPRAAGGRSGKTGTSARVVQGAGACLGGLKVWEAAGLEESEHGDCIGGSRHEAERVEVLLQLP